MSMPNTLAPGRTPARQSDPEDNLHRVIVTWPVRWRRAATPAAAGRGGGGGRIPHPADGRTRRDAVATERDAATQAGCRPRACASECRRDTPATARTATSSPVSRRAPDSTTSPPMLCDVPSPAFSPGRGTDLAVLADLLGNARLDTTCYYESAGEAGLEALHPFPSTTEQRRPPV